VYWWLSEVVSFMYLKGEERGYLGLPWGGPVKDGGEKTERKHRGITFPSRTPLSVMDSLWARVMILVLQIPVERTTGLGRVGDPSGRGGINSGMKKFGGGIATGFEGMAFSPSQEHVDVIG